MDIQHIKTFLAAVAHGSFLDAATAVHVTQSTVSARIQKLEQSLGAQLFVRNRSGATLTLAGQRLLKHAKTLMLTYELARHGRWPTESLPGQPNDRSSNCALGRLSAALG